MFNIKKQSGEIILIILLVMAVGLTIGLSIASRSITDVQISNKLEESGRAFSAAEAGIENVLKQGLINAVNIGSTDIGDGTKYSVNVTTFGGTSTPFVFPSVITQGDSQTVWLVPHDASGVDESTRVYSGDTIDICWSSNGAITVALEVSVFFKASGVYKVARTAFDPDNSRRSSNKFDIVNDTSGGYCAGGGNTFSYKVTLDFTTMDPKILGSDSPGPLAIRLKPVYGDSKIAVSPVGGNLPEQGKSISSTGQTGSGVTRRWNVVQTYPGATDIFDYAIWSNTNLTK